MGIVRVDRHLEIPTVGARVDIGCGACILGRITVGDDCKIGANAVVIADVPAGSTAVGVPARVIRRAEGRGRLMTDLGVVAIGRNEGERLRRCLASLGGPGPAVVYVDSGSTDGSVELARSMGVEVVELDLAGRSPRPGPGTRGSSGSRRSPRASASSCSSTAIARSPRAGSTGPGRAGGQARRGRRLRPAARDGSRAVDLQPPGRPRVGHADRPGDRLRRRLGDAGRGLRGRRRFRPDRRGRRGARALPAAPRAGWTSGGSTPR